jgi:hypothetical protein
VKLSKSSWLVLASGIVLIAGISLGMSRSQQAEQQQQLTNKLAQAKEKLATVQIDEVAAQKNQLAQQIEQYSAQTDSAKQKLFAPEDDIKATDVILAAAKSFQVEVVSITSPGATIGELTGTECRVLPMTIQLSGNTEYLAGFISNLSQIFPTSVVQVMQITNAGASAPAPGAEPTPAAGPGNNTPQVASIPSAEINLVIYSYEGK